MYYVYQYCFLLFADNSSESAISKCPASESVNKSDLKKLQDVCSRNNWQVVNVPQDGHCMFSSLAIQLDRPLATQDIRKELVEYLRTHANIVSTLSPLHCIFGAHCIIIYLLTIM